MNFNSPTLLMPIETGIRSVLYQCQNCGAPVLLHLDYNNCLSITHKKCSRCGLQVLHCDDVCDYRFTEVNDDSHWLRVPDGCLLILKDEPA